MVFSSIPAYLDPVNWQPQSQPPQEQQQQQIIGTTTNNSSRCNSPSTHHHQLVGTTVLLQGPGPHHPPQSSTHSSLPPHVGSSSGTGAGTGGGGGGPTSTGSIRPGSMAERARMANIPMPEASLKCPRCESTNTKFCYFNNYSLSQPRHFCKTCRRYWTRGGALRNVPVGGGCRRNKRIKGGSSSKLSGASCSSDRSAAAASTNTTTTTSSSATSSVPSLNSTSSLMADILRLTTPHQVRPSPLRLMPPLTSLNLHHDYDHGGGGLRYGGGNMSATAASDVGFQLGSSSFSLSGGSGGGGGAAGGSCFLSAPPGPLHFPSSSLLGGMDSSTTSSLLYPFEGSIDMSNFGQVRPKLMQYPGMDMQQVDTGEVKMEENQELSLSRQFLGLHGNDQYWGGLGSNIGTGAGGSGGGSWSNNMSGVNSSCSTSHAL